MEEGQGVAEGERVLPITGGMRGKGSPRDNTKTERPMGIEASYRRYVHAKIASM